MGRFPDSNSEVCKPVPRYRGRSQRTEEEGLNRQRSQKGRTVLLPHWGIAADSSALKQARKAELLPPSDDGTGWITGSVDVGSMRDSLMQHGSGGAFDTADL